MAKRRKWQRPKSKRWHRCIKCWEDYETYQLLFSGDTNVCPHCGGKAYIPPAILSSEDDPSIKNRYENTCHLINVCDESGSTIGYVIYCKQGKHSYEWFNKQIKDRSSTNF